MRHLVPIALVSLLSLPTALAQQAPPAPSSSAVSGSVQNSDAAQTPDADAKPAKRGKARKPKKKRKAVKGPVANFPSFRVMPDGSSRISVEVTEKVIVAERKAEGRLAYRLKNTHVSVETNLLPLETNFFKTAAGRIMLVEASDEDLELVIELRQPSEATYRTVDTDQGMILQVDLPAPAQKPEPSKPAAPK